MQLELSNEQRNWLIVEINMQLRDANLAKYHADSLHDLFVKLTNRSHDCYLRNKHFYKSGEK